MKYHRLNSTREAACFTALPGTKYSYFNRKEYGNIFIRKVENKDDIIRAFNIRWQGYSAYFMSKEEMVDEYDLAGNSVIFLAEDEQENAVGTLRILDRRFGDIELDEFLDVNSLLPENERECIEATRLSIPPHPNARLIKFLLWKALLLYCLGNKINVILLSARPAVVRLYRCLLFDHLGPLGVYNHPLLANLEHHTLKHNITEKKPLLKAQSPSLYDFLYVDYHPNVHYNCFMPLKTGSSVYVYNYDNTPSNRLSVWV